MLKLLAVKRPSPTLVVSCTTKLLDSGNVPRDSAFFFIAM